MTKENKIEDNPKQQEEQKESIGQKLKNKLDPKIKKIEELEKQLSEAKSDYLRTYADFDNYRKRKEKEMLEIKDKAIVNFVLELLPAIDNFEMSLKMTDNKEMFIKGVEMINTNLKDTLKEHQFIEYIPKEGEDFNPHKHDPILIEDKTKQPGKVLAIIKKGYLYKSTIIRPARVQIAKEEETKIIKEDNLKKEE